MVQSYNMKKPLLFIFLVFISIASFAQKVETVYLNPRDSSANMYLAVQPENGPVKAFMFLLDGLGVSPKDVLVQTELPMLAAKQGILSIIPILQTGPLYFGSDMASQQALKDLIDRIVATYHLQG